MILLGQAVDAVARPPTRHSDDRGNDGLAEFAEVGALALKTVRSDYGAAAGPPKAVMPPFSAVLFPRASEVCEHSNHIVAACFYPHSGATVMGEVLAHSDRFRLLQLFFAPAMRASCGDGGGGGKSSSKDYLVGKISG